MPYEKPLPPVRDLLALAQKAQFPVSCADIVQIGIATGESRILTDFLRLFPAHEIFMSRADFMTRTEELEMLIEQERSTPTEILRSQQD